MNGPMVHIHSGFTLTCTSILGCFKSTILDSRNASIFQIWRSKLWLICTICHVKFCKLMPIWKTLWPWLSIWNPLMYSIYTYTYIIYNEICMQCVVVCILHICMTIMYRFKNMMKFIASFHDIYCIAKFVRHIFGHCPFQTYLKNLGLD